MTDTGVAPRRKARRRGVLIATVCVLAVGTAGGGVAAALTVDGGNKLQHEQSVETATATVKRGTLTGNTSASGTLAYADSRSIVSGAGGVVTALPLAGAQVGLGQQLFSIDNKPTFLFFGPLPAWRGFESGMDDGPDVKALEESLKSLGFFENTPDAEFTWWTKKAIQDWQKATGQERSGTITFGSVVFSTSDVRVSTVLASVGDQAGAGTAIVNVTALTKRVNVNLKLASQTLAVVGAKVSIDLPGGKNTSGTVTAVGVPTEQETNGKKDVVIPVVITLDDAASAGNLQQATVTVGFPTEERKNVLSVPVEALIALTNKAFGVEIVHKDGTTTKVAVKTGLFAAGFVEISGSGISEGQDVVVPAL